MLVVKMGIREVVAERVSPIRKRFKIETPLIDEIPVTAQIISNLALELPEILGKVPIIARGKAYGERSGLWYRVSFPRGLSEPSVVAVAEGRLGAIPSVAAPKITIPTVEVALPTIDVAKTIVSVPLTIDIPAPTTADIPIDTIPYINESFPYLTSDIAWVRDQICKPLNQITESLYRLQGRLNDTIGRVNSGLAKTKKAIEDGYGASKKAVTDTNLSISDLRAKAETTINAGLKVSRDNVQKALNSGLSGSRDSVQKALNTTVINTQDSVNQGLASLIPSLYAAWGLPSTMIITPVHVRNVTTTGFEFQSYGKTTCYYIAVGSRL